MYYKLYENITIQIKDNNRKKKGEKQMKEKMETVRGITLIALVITIIVLLILAGVTIATLTGENGILSKATEAKTENIVGQEEEQVKMAYSAALAQKNGEEITSEDLQEELDNLVGENKTEVLNLENKWNIHFFDTNHFYDIEDGKISSSEEIVFTEFVLTSENHEEAGILSTTGDIVIPAIFNKDGVWYKITEIGAKAFYGYTDLTGITIPETVKVIGNQAFQNCTQLKNIKLPESITEINGNAFYACSSITSINIPKNVQVIRGNAFFNCSNLEEVIIEEGVTDFNGTAFQNCPKLEEIELPETIISFNFDRSSVKRLTIPANVRKIDDYALAGGNLETIIFEGEEIDSISQKAFASQSGTTEDHEGYARKLTTIYVPKDSVEKYKEKFGDITYNGSNLARDLIQAIQ